MSAERVFDDLIQISELGPLGSVILGGRKGRGGFPSYRLAQLSADLSREFQRIALDSLKTRANERRNVILGPYDAQYVPESHEIRYIKTSENREVQEFLDSIPEPGDADVFEDDDALLRDLRFFVVTLKDGRGRPIRLFRTITPGKKLTMTEGIVARLVGRRFEKLEDTSLVFEPGFQVIAFEGYVFILSQHGFETLFQFYENLRGTAEETLDEIDQLVPISNFGALRADAMKHLGKIRKLRNIRRSSYLPQLTMARLRATIEEFGLPVRIVPVNGEEQLEYDPENPWALLELLEDQFVKSSTTGKKYAANSKREITVAAPRASRRRPPAPSRRRRASS